MAVGGGRRRLARGGWVLWGEGGRPLGGWQVIGWWGGWVEPGGGGEESLFIFPPKVNYGAKFGRMKKRKEKKKKKKKKIIK